MRISIVVPSYNGERFLGRTLEGVLAQTLDDWELIVVDDGSNDDTRGVASVYAEQDARVRWVAQENRGIAAARNRGFAAVSTEANFIIFLDHDDVWVKDALARLVSHLEQNPDWVAVSGLCRVVDTHEWPIVPGYLESWGRSRWGIVNRRLVRWPLHEPTSLAVLAYENRIHTPGSVLIRRRALEQTGLFDPEVSPCDDWDLWLRLCQQGDIGFVDRVVLNWRSHDGNTSNQTQRMAHQIACVRRKLLRSTALSPPQREIVLMSNWLWGSRARSEAVQRAKASLTQWQVRPALCYLSTFVSSYLRCLCQLPAA